MTAFYQIKKAVIKSSKKPSLMKSICVLGTKPVLAVGIIPVPEMVPVRVAEMVPFRVAEIVPFRVAEMVPFLVPDIVPDFARVVVEKARANIAAHATDLTFFIVLLLMFFNVLGNGGRLKCLLAEPSLGRPQNNLLRIHSFQRTCHNAP